MLWDLTPEEMKKLRGGAVDIWEREMSGGQQQRVSIGRALINNPAFVLADEPTGNLDSKTGKEIMDLLKYSNQMFNQTVLIITHDDKIALQTDRIITMRDGNIINDEVIKK